MEEFKKVFPPNKTTDMNITSKHIDLIKNCTIDLSLYTKLCNLDVNLCDGRYNNIFVEGFKIINFPPKINNIKIEHCFREYINITELTNLPNLSSLWITSSNYTNDDFLNLPKKLQLFGLFHPNSESYMFNNLPLGLKKLYLSGVKIDEMEKFDNLPLGLEELIIKNCWTKFSTDMTTDMTIDMIMDMTTLRFIEYLENLPETLKKLNCSDNKIKNLENLPSGLKYLDCSNNYLTALNNLPIGLEELHCASNQIILIERLPHTLKIANCIGNPLISKPNCPNSLTLLNFSLDNEKASMLDKTSMIGNKVAYGTYHTGKYIAYGIGMTTSLACALIASPVIYAYSKLNK